MKGALSLLCLMLAMSCGGSADSEEEETEESSGDEEPPRERAELIVVQPGDGCIAKPLPPNTDDRTRKVECISMLYGAQDSPRCDWKREFCQGADYGFSFSQSTSDATRFEAIVIGPDPIAAIEEGFHWEDTGYLSYRILSDVFAGPEQAGMCIIHQNTAYLCPIGKEPGEPSDFEYAQQQEQKQNENADPNAPCRMAAWWYGSQPASSFYGKMFEECSKLFFPDKYDTASCTSTRNGAECRGPRPYELRMDEAQEHAELRFTPDSERPDAIFVMALKDEEHYEFGISVVGNFLPEGKMGACKITRERIERCVFDAKEHDSE